MRYWIKILITIIAVTISVSSGLDAVIHYFGSINSANNISSSAFNITEPIALLVAFFIVLRFKPTNDKDTMHYHLIKKILLAVIVVSTVYGIGNEFLRIYGSYASPFVLIFVYTKNIAMGLTIILVYQKFKSSQTNYDNLS